MSRAAEVEFLCPSCEARSVVPLDEARGTAIPQDVTCQACGDDLTILDPRGGKAPGSPVVQCAACACPKLYVQKDFNRNVGLLVVAVTALISGIVLMLTGSTLWAMLVLGVVTAFDAVVYRLLPVVTVCYRCEAVHRGFPVNPAHQGFDIHTAEEFAYGAEGRS